MRHKNRFAWFVCAVAVAGLLPACQPAATPPVYKPSVLIDPCAERLHDLCGLFLLHYAAHQRLPADLDELKALAPAGAALVCPTSGTPYVYRPAGLQIPGRQGRLLLFDAEPAHSGMRWAVVADDGAAGRLAVLRVQLLPDGPAFSTPRD